MVVVVVVVVVVLTWLLAWLLPLLLTAAAHWCRLLLPSAAAAAFRGQTSGAHGGRARANARLRGC
jgi:hypothetical protein